MIPLKVEVREYIDDKGCSTFQKWFMGLDVIAASKINTGLYRLEQGNFSNVKNLGEGIFEYKIDFGPGYRIYFGKDALTLIILLAGGTKKQQNKDIKLAKQKWKEYKGKN